MYKYKFHCVCVCIDTLRQMNKMHCLNMDTFSINVQCFHTSKQMNIYKQILYKCLYLSLSHIYIYIYIYIIYIYIFRLVLNKENSQVLHFFHHL